MRHGPVENRLFDFVSAPSQVATNLLLRPSLTKSQKSSFRIAASFLSPLLPEEIGQGFGFLSESASNVF
jgi:hypothetical protein